LAAPKRQAGEAGDRGAQIAAQPGREWREWAKHWQFRAAGVIR